MPGGTCWKIIRDTGIMPLMATIDQRILIPSSQQTVWQFLSDLHSNPLWQQDCTQVSFLSSKHNGLGTRWRSTSARGHDTVYEITSWYNGLGYEYRSIDGGHLRGIQGRLRLQEIPEGTIVQWTFSFEGGGVLSGLRGVSRQVDASMAASLKALYRQLKANAARPDTGVVASLMKDAPDVDGRTHYQPRHMPVYSEPITPAPAPPAVNLPTLVSEPPVAPEDAQPVQTVPLIIDEPPVSIEDTRPRAAVSAEAQPHAPEPEPDFLSTLPRAESASAAAAHTAAPASAESAVQPPAAPPPSTIETTLLESAAELELPAPAAAPILASPAEPTPAALPASPAVESAERSIWEIFGVERPQTLVPAAAPVPVTPLTPAAASEPAPTVAHVRIGLRARERRRSAGVRYP